jgi:bifunctional non-homologous end joining protein LigD
VGNDERLSGIVFKPGLAMEVKTKSRIAQAAESPMPQGVKPMLSTLLKQPFQDPGFIYEVKWDGYRLIAYKDAQTLRLASRGGHDYTRKYPPIVRGLETLPHRVVLDGEAIVLNEEGRPDFDALQNFNGQKSGVLFYVFDILWVDGHDLMKRPLLERKEILRDVVGNNPVIRYSDHFEDGIELFRHAESMRLEGIIAKQKNSHYTPDRRGKEWYKIPTEIRQEFVIGGWVESESRLFRTLLFGAYQGDDLQWIGHAGGGFKEREMGDILAKLKALEINTSPFVNHVEYEGVVHWVKPELVANIKYATLTRSGKIRKPAIFLGFRQDKIAREVVREIPASAPADRRENDVEVRPAEDSNWALVDSEVIRNEEVLQVEGCDVRVYNVDRTLWKGITKAGLIQYYVAMAPYLLPHIKERPLSLHVKLKGPYAPGAYIKDMEGRQPECADIFTTRRKHHKAGKRDVIDYLVCNNTPTLLYTINLGCIDVNPWTSAVRAQMTPHYVVVDLDPSDGDFSKAIETARAAKELFDKYKLKAFVKTSGKTGIHIYLPCSGYTFPQAREIAESICHAVHQLVPEITTTELAVADRGAKLYLDPNQNDYSDTVAAPYCARPFKVPTVSAPLTWREIKSSLHPGDFTIYNMQKRVSRVGDLFAGVLDRKVAAANDEKLLTFL